MNKLTASILENKGFKKFNTLAGGIITYKNPIGFTIVNKGEDFLVEVGRMLIFLSYVEELDDLMKCCKL